MDSFRIYYYLTKSEKRPINEFINALQPVEQAKVDAVFRLLQEYGNKIGMPHAKKVRGTPLWELRIKSKRTIRLFYTVYGKENFLFLHGFIKKTQKIPTKEIKIALRRFKNMTS
ncbi:type II toxin-antitoxin system RelE/ParE family toxin [Patescibacteria group bacterium]|nr:type II toxin-antitoxin system RelE/ParE family toxin [Patescibacteria group bacterium]